MRRTHPAGVVLFLVSLLALLPTSADAQVVGSSLVGDVKDQQSAVVPGATVTLTDTATEAQRVATTDATGSYRFIALAPGIYTLKVELQGFRTEGRERVEIKVDTAGRLDTVVLTVGRIEEVVNVQASAVRNTTDGTLGQTIGAQQITALPLEARNPIALMSLQPGAVFLPTGDPRSGAVPRTGN